MKTGVIISGVLHGIMLVLILLRLPWGGPDIREDVVQEVTTISASEFDAITSDAPLAPATEMAVMMQPTSEVNDTVAPQDTAQPEATEIDITDDPSARDNDPDLTAVERLAQPDVQVETAQPDAPDVAPQISPTFSTGLSGNTSAPSFNAPPVPRSAPRVADTAAPSLPDISRTSDRSVEETVPDETATTPVEEQVSEAIPEAVTEIVPEAQPDAPPSAAPPRNARPVRRSSNAAANAQAIAQALQEQEEEDVRNALAQLNEETVATPAAQTAPLTGAQKRGIGEAVAQNWNKSIVLGKANYENLIVKVAVSVGPDGEILGDVEPVDPANPTGDFLVAYEAARRAVLRAGSIPLPAGRYPDGVRLILRFDPVQGIGLN